MLNEKKICVIFILQHIIYICHSHINFYAQFFLPDSYICKELFHEFENDTHSIYISPSKIVVMIRFVENLLWVISIQRSAKMI